MHFQMQNKLFRFDKLVCEDRALNLNISSKLLRHFEGIRGKPACWMKDLWGLKG